MERVGQVRLEASKITTTVLLSLRKAILHPEAEEEGFKGRRKRERERKRKRKGERECRRGEGELKSVSESVVFGSSYEFCSLHPCLLSSAAKYFHILPR